MPYRVYVPTSYKADRAYPLVIALHGNGLTEDNFFTGFEALTPKIAEERGYIVAAPLGYRVDGGYGRNNGSRSAEELPKLELSEKDVMRGLALNTSTLKCRAALMVVLSHQTFAPCSTSSTSTRELLADQRTALPASPTGAIVSVVEYRITPSVSM